MVRVFFVSNQRNGSTKTYFESPDEWPGRPRKGELVKFWDEIWGEARDVDETNGIRALFETETPIEVLRKLIFKEGGLETADWKK